MSPPPPLLEGLPGEALASIACQLPCVERLCLAAASCALQSSSLERSEVWWPVVDCSFRNEEQAASLSSWLLSNRPRLQALLAVNTAPEALADRYRQEQGAMENDWELAELARPVVTLPSPPLPGLCSLDLSWQRHGPPQLQAILRLASLERLTLRGCSLTTIPSALARLSDTLVYLDLESNPQLSEGLQHVGKLSQLVDLRLRDCGMAALPADFSGLCSLRYLDLSETAQLTAGLEHLGRLPCLVSLHLGAGGAEALPPELSGLSGLRTLHLGAPSTALPGGLQHLAVLPQLSHLCLHGGGVSDLPALQRGFPALHTVEARGCTAVPTLSVSRLAALPQLHSLALVDCSLAVLPAGMSNMSLLRSLSLAANPLLGSTASAAASFRHLARLTRLQHLSLEHCELTSVPSPLVALSNLLSLDLAYNRELAVAGLSPLARLCQLTSVRLAGCAAATASSRPALAALLAGLESLSISRV